MADKIVVLNAGRIEQVGSPMDLYNNPVSPFVAGFIGSPKMNLYDGEVAAAEGCTSYGIRPEHLVLSKSEGKWQGLVRHIERLGADTVVYLDHPLLKQIVARVPGDFEIASGEVVHVSPMSGKEHRFN